MSDSRAADELAIRGLVARYAEAVSSRNREQWAATWTEDGQWSVMGQTSHGRDDTVALWDKLLGSLEFVVQLANSGTVEFDESGDRATGRWQITEHGKFASGGGTIFTIGFYKDVCVRENGKWLFQSRSFHPLYFGPPDLSAQVHPFPKDD